MRALRRRAARLRVVAALPRVLAVALLVEWRIRRVPTRELAARQGLELDLRPEEARGHGTGRPLSPRELRQLRATRWLMRRWPFGAGPCLRESLVVGRLLRGRSPRLKLGIAPDGGGIIAHAWVEVDGHWIGYDRRYTAFQERRVVRFVPVEERGDAVRRLR